MGVKGVRPDTIIKIEPEKIKIKIESEHDKLVKVAHKWLIGSMLCGFAVKEFCSSSSESPDAFGLRSSYTILVECKTSRADFFADKKKIFRRFPEQGIGDFRFFLCPEGLIKVDELPEKWGLLYWNGKIVKKIHAPKGNIWYGQEEFRFKKSIKSEYQIMYSCLRRKSEDLQKYIDPLNKELTI